MDYAIQQIVNALAFGSEYALLALGLALVFSIMGLVNFAHGEIIAVAGYSVFFAVALGLQSVVGAVTVAVLMGIVTALVFERVAFRPVRYAPTTTGLLTAFGVSIVVQNMLTLFVSPKPRAVSVLGPLNQTIVVGPYAVSSLQLLELAVTIIGIVALVLFLNRSLLGLAIRAAARDFSTVRLMGVKANRVIATGFALSGFLAGVVSIFILARRGSVEPDFGSAPVIKAFVACVLGGFGSLAGAAVGGMVLGVLDVAILVALPQKLGGLRDALTYFLVGVVLFVRPQGLLGRRVELGDKEV
jgi:branched-chain amino acid transport system permease protein